MDTAYSFPAQPSAPAGVLITAPSPAGTDSVYWRIPRSGIGGRTCKTCQDWLSTIFVEQHGIIPNSTYAEEQVFVADSSRKYSKYSASQDGAPLRSPDRTSKTILAGIGAVYFSANRSTTKASWSYGFRLLEYNGINIDTLWGTTLTGPVAIAPRKSAINPAVRTRTFDLHEMGIFLGRVPQESRPVPASTPR